MKTIFTFFFILLVSVATQAQSAPVETQGIKVETIQMGIVTSKEFKAVAVKKSSIEVARLYKFKNSRIKKALRFTTKKNRAKMA